ncbi:hypothetical protein DRP43_06310 [candidate division TA06 bacterium]|uniref:Uncharacterized protein n=1 Tax=candidate division TA06 bacterium TaxID=2250710 RepID=A0A660SAI9_UNCT6|nr:MAG: hypothetical protein DRP43_06310 [candidate division TA06 bacterium]
MILKEVSKFNDKKRKEYFAMFGKNSAEIDRWIFVQDTIWELTNLILDIQLKEIEKSLTNQND